MSYFDTVFNSIAKIVDQVVLPGAQNKHDWVMVGVTSSPWLLCWACGKGPIMYEVPLRLYDELCPAKTMILLQSRQEEALARAIATYVCEQLKSKAKSSEEIKTS